MSSLPPVNVSPLIKLARWAALVYGVNYGSNRREKLAIIEEERRAEEERTREDRERYIKIEKDKIEKRDLLEIEGAFLGEQSDSDFYSETSLEIESGFYGEQSGKDGPEVEEFAKHPDEKKHNYFLRSDKTILEEKRTSIISSNIFPGSVADENKLNFPDETDSNPNNNEMPEKDV